MASVDITAFDLIPYQSLPPLHAEATYRLAVDLAEARPTNAPEHVDRRVLHMLISSERIREVLITPASKLADDSIREVDFDGLLEQLWRSGRAELQARMLWADPTAALLSADEAGQIDLERKRVDAEIARELHDQLYAEGVTFVHEPYPAQIEAMASRIELMTCTAKAEDYARVFGPDRLAALRVVFGRYHAMVSERSSHSDAREQLRLLRANLQRQIDLYAGTVLGLLDEQDPVSLAEIRAALQPMLDVRRAPDSASAIRMVVAD